MMKVVVLRRFEERHVISRMIVECDKNYVRCPDPSGNDVTAQDRNPHHGREHVGYDVLHWVAVNGCDSDWRCPFVMLFVDVLIQVTAMK
jgi:hypothetical protein